MEEIIAILDTALNRVQAGEPLESVLASYPEQGEQLIPLLEGALALQLLHPVVMPGDESLQRQRHAFLDQLASLQAPTVSSGRLKRLKGQIQAAVAGMVPATPYLLKRPKEVRPMRAMIVQFVVIVALIAGTVSGTAAATARSVPGSALYGMKLNVEDARLALTGDPQRAAEMHMAFAGERVEEMQQAALAGEQVDRQTRLRLERHLENALRLAAQVGDNGQMVGLLQRMQLRYQAHENELAELEVRVQQRGGSELAQARHRLEQAAQAAGAGMNDPAQFRWRYTHNRNEEAPLFWEEHDPAVPTPAGNQHGQPESIPNQGDENRNQHQNGAPGDAPSPGSTSDQGGENQQQNGPPAESSGGQDSGNDSGQGDAQMGSGTGKAGSGGGGGN